jgi:membrane protein implicated in regulation of membrane protease activity
MSPPFAGLLLAALQTPGSIEEVGNPMAPHALFIILVVAAFLAWAASFSVHTMKERSRQKDRETLAGRRERVLDAITRLELERESAAIDERTYRSRMQSMRGDLARVVTELRVLGEEPQQEGKGAASAAKTGAAPAKSAAAPAKSKKRGKKKRT